MNKFTGSLAIALVSFASVARAQSDATLQCTAPSFTAGYEIPLVLQVFNGASKMGDTSSSTEGPTRWTDRFTKMGGGEAEVLRTSHDSGKSSLAKLTGWPNEISVAVSGGGITWYGGTKDVVFPLVQGKEWEHTYYRQEPGVNQRIKVKARVTKVERVGDDIHCTIERKVEWDRSFGHYILSVSVFSKLKEWAVRTETYRTDTKVYTRILYFGAQAN